MAGPIEIVQQLLAPAQPGADIWGALIGDRIGAYRVRQAMKLQAQLHSEAARLGVKIKPDKVPERYALSWFEEATKQDEEELQVLFARLLARAADEQNEEKPDRRLLSILTHFTPEDAEVFQALYSVERLGAIDQRLDGIERSHVCMVLKQTFGDDRLDSIEHLASLACLSLTTGLDKSAVAARARTMLDGSTNVAGMIADRTKMKAFVGGTRLGRALFEAIKD